MILSAQSMVIDVVMQLLTSSNRIIDPRPCQAQTECREQIIGARSDSDNTGMDELAATSSHTRDDEHYEHTRRDNA